MYHCEQCNQYRFEKYVGLFVWQIQFYLHHIPLSCITTISIKERSISKRSSIGPRV